MRIQVGIIFRFVAIFSMSLLFTVNAAAHHVIGKPVYNSGNNSGQQSTITVETQIGDYYLTYMMSPALPEAGENGRISLHASRLDNDKVFDGEIKFIVRDDGWFGDKHEEVIGVQKLTDGLYRQGFLFDKKGQYIISAVFESEGEPYMIDFPLQVGENTSINPLGFSLGLILFVLAMVNIIKRKRKKYALTSKL